MRPGEIEELRRLAAAAGTTVGVYARETLRRRIRRAGDIRPGQQSEINYAQTQAGCTSSTRMTIPPRI